MLISPKHLVRGLRHALVVIHSSLGQRLIRHEWEASLPNVGLSKSLRTKAQRHFQRRQYLIGGRDEVLPHLTFNTPNTKNQLLSNISNLIRFGMELQYALKYESVRTRMPKFYMLIFYSLFLSLLPTYLSSMTTTSESPKARSKLWTPSP